ncbi:MAG: hypothetical protein NUV47_02420 [Patescibacteria group bacterium]|nr:hypothetical protein [Patescibacteria group bacterium]
MSVDAINNILGDIGFSFGKAIDKVKSTATEAAAKYQEMSPQAQAIKTAAGQFKGGGKAPTFRMPATSSGAIPTTKSSYKTGIGGTISKLVKKKVFGIPVMIPVLGIFVGLPMLKKYAKKR